MVKPIKYIILMYHKIGLQPYEFTPSLNVKIFEKQINLLRRLYDVISLEEIFSSHLTKKGKSKLIITFDDGYRCIYKYAYPILKKYGVPATIFLTVSSIEENKPIWTDLIGYYFETTPEKRIEIVIQDNRMNLSLNNREGRLSALKQIKDLLKDISNKEKLIIIEELRNKLNVNNPGNGTFAMLNWQEINEMSGNNITFGGHTLNHPILSRIPLEEVKKEIIESKRIIEDKISRSVSAFAYPNGQPEDFNEGVKRILKETGYKVACTTIFGKNDNNTDPYELKRIYTSGNSLFKFIGRVWKA